MSEHWELVIDVLALLCVVGATALTVAAGIGLLRFSDALSRLHAATKPQVLGLLLTIAAVSLENRSFGTLLALLPVFVLQALTAPIAAHMVGRAAYRTGQLDDETLVLDELAPAIVRSEAERERD